MSASKAYLDGLGRLGNFGDLFTSQEERDEAKKEHIEQIGLEELFPFKDHPFSVRDDEEMEQLVDSIKRIGVTDPLIARPKEDGTYEVISGHRRLHAAQLAGLAQVPVRLQNIDDDTAIIQMVDANLHRQHILPSEKAKAYQMKLEAIKRKGGRPSKNNSRQVGENFDSIAIVSAEAGESERKIQRLIRLNSLIPELQEMVDENKLKMVPAVEISFLEEDHQRDFLDYLDDNQVTPSISQAQKLKALSKDGEWSIEKMQEIMTAQPPSVKPREKPKEQGCFVPRSAIEKYIPKGFNDEQIQNFIIRALEAEFNRRRNRSRER